MSYEPAMGKLQSRDFKNLRNLERLKPSETLVEGHTEVKKVL
jgi:hypothetical protein